MADSRLALSTAKITKEEAALLKLIPFVVRCSKSRRTRAMLSVSRFDLIPVIAPKELKQLKKLPVQFNGGEGDWLVCCLTHKQAKLFSRGRDAYSAIGNPEIFCSKCNDYTAK